MLCNSSNDPSAVIQHSQFARACGGHRFRACAPNGAARAGIWTHLHGRSQRRELLHHSSRGGRSELRDPHRRRRDNTRSTWTITRTLTLNGAGAGSTIVDGTNTGTVFSITANSAVTLNALTITGGKAETAAPARAAAAPGGTAGTARMAAASSMPEHWTLTNSAISSNSAGTGGSGGNGVGAGANGGSGGSGGGGGGILNTGHACSDQQHPHRQPGWNRRGAAAMGSSAPAHYLRAARAASAEAEAEFSIPAR